MDLLLRRDIILIVESLVRKKWKFFYNALFGAIAVISFVIFSIFLKTGTFQMVQSQDTYFSPLISGFYFVNSVHIWGLAFLLVPFSFIFKKTYIDKYNYSLIAWFLFSLLFWSSNVTNHQFRFTIEFTPAVYFLSVLAVENFVKSNLSFSGFRKFVLKAFPDFFNEMKDWLKRQ